VIDRTTARQEPRGACWEDPGREVASPGKKNCGSPDQFRKDEEDYPAAIKYKNGIMNWTSKWSALVEKSWEERTRSSLAFRGSGVGRCNLL